MKEEKTMYNEYEYGRRKNQERKKFAAIGKQWNLTCLAKYQKLRDDESYYSGVSRRP